MSCYIIERSPDAVRAAADAKLQILLPLEFKMTNGLRVQIFRLDRSNKEELDILHHLLNEEIRAGTYPQDRELDIQGFLAYYCSESVFVARALVPDETEAAAGTTFELCGSFYVKKNFPGRCDHICNGGFLVRKGWRGKGVGKALGSAFQQVAPALGFRASFFNLVFVDNPASIALWDGLGFRRVGRVPEAKIIEDGTGVDALMYYMCFDVGTEKEDKDKEQVESV